MPVRGLPMTGPNRASTSGMLIPSSSISCITFTIPCTPIRLPTKFGVSLAHTIPLPKIRSPKSAINSSISVRVSSPGIISSSFMYRTGLKKWVPRKCCLNSLLRPLDMPFNGIPEVFVETMVLFFRTASIRFKRSCLIFKFSTMTSTIQSTAPIFSKSSSRLPIVMRSASRGVIKSAGWITNAASRPAFTIRLRASGSFFSSVFKFGGTISSKSVFMPAPASRAAIPPPIIPEPMTAADRIFLGIMASSSIVGKNNE